MMMLVDVLSILDAKAQTPQAPKPAGAAAAEPPGTRVGGHIAMTPQGSWAPAIVAVQLAMRESD